MFSLRNKKNYLCKNGLCITLSVPSYLELCLIVNYTAVTLHCFRFMLTTKIIENERLNRCLMHSFSECNNFTKESRLCNLLIQGPYDTAEKNVYQEMLWVILTKKFDCRELYIILS